MTTTVMWREFISKLSKDAEFYFPAGLDRIKEVESALGTEFPGDLRDLLLESNGVHGEYELGLVWSIERIEADNLRFRMHDSFKTAYMPFDNLLFFADAGNGDQFAYPIQANRICRSDVLVWDHESDSRRWVARSLKQYLQGWLDGSLTL